jgi:isopenicillin N synthase-like dioxygenase
MVRSLVERLGLPVARIHHVLQGQFDNPTTLFRMFNCKFRPSTPHRHGVFGTWVCVLVRGTHRLLSDPPHPDVDSDGLPLFGVGEHTDYGYLTLLLQDNSGGLQVKLADGSWIDAPPVQGSLVVNLGDALEHNTGCLIKATPHRVKHTSNANRMSFPFFFDPSFSKRMESIVSQLPEGE